MVGITANAKSRGNIWTFVDVYFAYFDGAGVFGGQLLDQWGNHPARSAPGSPKIDQHWRGRMKNFILESLV